MRSNSANTPRINGSGAGHGRIWLPAALLLGAMMTVNQAPVEASQPVSVVIQGCVRHGVLRADFTDFGTHQVDSSHQPYRMTVLDATCRRGAPMRDCRMNLSNLEGKRIEISGDLMPGDSFLAIPASIQVLGPCRSRR